MNSRGGALVQIDNASVNSITATQASVSNNGVKVPQSLTYTLQDTGLYYRSGHSAPPNCVVPNLYKVTLATARYRLAAHHCRLGHVSWLSRYTGTRSFRRMVRYWPHWRIVSPALWMVGSRHPNGTKVALIGVK